MECSHLTNKYIMFSKCCRLLSGDKEQKVDGSTRDKHGRKTQQVELISLHCLEDLMVLKTIVTFEVIQHVIVLKSGSSIFRHYLEEPVKIMSFVEVFVAFLCGFIFISKVLKQRQMWNIIGILSLCALHLVPSLSKQSLTHTRPRDMNQLVECLSCVSEVLSTFLGLEKQNKQKNIIDSYKPSLNLKITGAKFSHLYQVNQAHDLLSKLFCWAYDNG